MQFLDRLFGKPSQDNFAKQILRGLREVGQTDELRIRIVNYTPSHVGSRIGYEGSASAVWEDAPHETCRFICYMDSRVVPSRSRRR